MEVCINKEDLENRASCIYKITNTSNGKIYIGQTRDIRSRSSDYRNGHTKINPLGMYRHLKEEGTENFKMEIIEKCEPEKLTERENYYIDFYDTLNPEKGYNKMYVTVPLVESAYTRALKSKSHQGLKETATTKRKKSNPIIAIKDDTLILSDSAKLFGDYIGKNKDLIKNGLRDPTSILGYNLYYDDGMKRIEIKKKVSEKKSIRNPNYLKYLEIINQCELDGVETIYDYFKIYKLSYDEIDSDGKPILIELGTA